jgi:peptidylprolyl isomerase
MEQVKNGDVVKVHYLGRLTNGTTFDSSEGRSPLEFEVGSGMVIPGFEKNVIGMEVGEKKTIQIPVEDAYGPLREDLYIEFPKERFPETMQPEVGMALNMKDEAGREFPVVIDEVTDEFVVLNANHPLAGEDLIFDIEVVEIKGKSPLIILP